MWSYTVGLWFVYICIMEAFLSTTSVPETFSGHIRLLLLHVCYQGDLWEGFFFTRALYFL